MPATWMKPVERALAVHLVMVMRDMSLEAELGVVEGERMNAIGRWRGSGGGKSLLFNGHIDTNPVSEGWTVDPWGGCHEVLPCFCLAPPI